MDFSSLKEQVSNLTLYDIKAGVRKVQNGRYSNPASSGIPSSSLDSFSPEPTVYNGVRANNFSCFLAVMNYTEMESKVCCHRPANRIGRFALVLRER